MSIKSLNLKVKKYIVFRNREINRRLNELSKKEKPKARKQFTIFKDSNGRPRWVTISSNAFRDKDGEIVSTKALKGAVSKADARYKALRAKGMTAEKANVKTRGYLRWWHVPGLELGVCDFQMVDGRMLIESGYFNSDSIAMKMSTAKDMNISIGFRHPSTEPDTKGVFNQITIFERSPVPQGKAANNFTSLTVKGAENMSNIELKMKMARELFGDDLDFILDQAKTQEKEAISQVGDVYGQSYKETDSPTISELMEVWNAYKEAESELLSDDNDQTLWDEPEAETEEETKAASEKMDHMVELKASMSRIEERLNKLISGLGGKADEEAKKEASTLARIAQLEAELATLKGEQPQAMKGYRASLEGAPIEDDAPKSNDDWQLQRQKAAQEMGPSYQMMTAAEKLAVGLFGQ